MIDIYICEDIKEHRDNIAHCVEEALTFREYDMRLVISTDKPEVIIEQLKISKNTGLYFLDIDLKSDKNGIELAKEIRDYEMPLEHAVAKRCSNRQHHVCSNSRGTAHWCHGV